MKSKNKKGRGRGLVSSLFANFHSWVVRNATSLNAYGSIVGMAAAVFVIVGGITTYIQLMSALEHPDVTLRFADSSGPIFWIENRSNKLATSILYEMRMFNLSDTSVEGRPLNLQIPVQSIDFIRSGTANGPYSIRYEARLGSRIEQGHFVFGHAQVQCPTCETVRHYWILAEIGKAGWYAEVSQKEASKSYSVFRSIVRGEAEFRTEIDNLVPRRSRIAF